jgi:hypothetical protein
VKRRTWRMELTKQRLPRLIKPRGVTPRTLVVDCWVWEEEEEEEGRGTVEDEGEVEGVLLGWL